MADVSPPPPQATSAAASMGATSATHAASLHQILWSGLEADRFFMGGVSGSGLWWRPGCCCLFRGRDTSQRLAFGAAACARHRPLFAGNGAGSAGRGGLAGRERFGRWAATVAGRATLRLSLGPGTGSAQGDQERGGPLAGRTEKRICIHGVVSGCRACAQGARSVVNEYGRSACQVPRLLHNLLSH